MLICMKTPQLNHSCAVIAYGHFYYGRINVAFYGNRVDTSAKVSQVNKSSILQGFLFSYLCPCSSMAVPLRPPMSHMMMEWSELPEKRTLWTGSQQSAVTLPGAKHIKQHKYIQKTHHHEGGFSQHIHVDKLSGCLGGPELSQLLITQREKI